MSRVDKHGVSTRQHLQQVMQHTGEPPEELLGPKMPRELRYMWEAFLSLHEGRTYGEAGPNPLSYTEMKAWCDLCHEDLRVWEISIVKALDATFLSVQNEKAGQ